MSVTRSQRLDRLAGYAENEQNAASTHLVELQKQLDDQESRLADLRDYLANYHLELDRARSGEVKASWLKNYATFLDHLKQVVDQQEHHVEAVRHQYERQLQVWNEKRTRVKAVEKAADRCRDQEQRIHQRSEQRTTDDLVAGNLLRRTTRP